jgi:hypothetical protein
MRYAAAALLLAFCLTGCGPSFKDKIAGEWECTGTSSNPASPGTIEATLFYTRSNEVRGDVTASFTAYGDTVAVYAKMSGSWKYDGDTMTQTITDTLDRIEVNGTRVPASQIPEEMRSEFGSEESFADRVELVDGKLFWLSDEGTITCDKK